MTRTELSLTPTNLQAQWDLAKDMREQGYNIGARIAANKMLKQAQEITCDMDAMNTLVNGGRNA